MKYQPIRPGGFDYSAFHLRMEETYRMRQRQREQARQILLCLILVNVFGIVALLSGVIAYQFWVYVHR